jgi:hypothetical protein
MISPSAVETLHQQEKKRHEIYYIAARPKKHGERTKDWLKENE